METDFVLPINFINLKITALGKYGIFRPSVETSSQYKRYKFVRSIRSCLLLTLELYFIKGDMLVACVCLKITSNGNLRLYSG